MQGFLRPFLVEKDKDKMIALARQSPADNLHVIDLPYRLSSWAMDEPNNVAVWSDEDHEIIAWGVLQTPFWAIDYVCHPAASSQLHAEILVWADERAQAIIESEFGHPAWYVMVFEEQKDRIHDLETLGYRCQEDVGENSWSQVLMCRSSDTAVRIYQPPTGFTVRSLAGESDVEAYVALHQSVFESRNMTAGWRSRTIRHPAYTRELDIVVESPDGELVAFCIGWFDENSRDGQIEPLGCHKNFRHFALGRVALSECLHRLQSLGAKNIFVETDNYRNTAFRLYESFYFQVVKKVLVYRKDFSP